MSQANKTTTVGAAWGSSQAGLVTAIAMCLFAASVFAEVSPTMPSNAPDIARRAAAEGKLAFKLTTPDELKALLGPAVKETKKGDGGMEVLDLEYAGVQAKFGRMKRYSTPFALLGIAAEGEGIDIGQNRRIVLWDAGDLKKFDPFWGFANASLAKLDLRESRKLLEAMPFDSRTLWPDSGRLPNGFDPRALLEEGKIPGLGVRTLHAQGIDGRGVGIAVIDQPLLKDHVEYADRIVRYQAVDVQGFPPQMHGPAVASIAAGKTCGVAPAASLYYFAVPMWKRDNKPYCDVIDTIVSLNERADTTERIRVVSISTGMFPQQANFDRWKEALKKAERHGILVVTCSQDRVAVGMLARIDGKDPDDPSSYAGAKYGVRPGAVLVPASNRTTASHEGRDVYTFWREAGMSWATPYLAGVAVLAYQVNPAIEPDTIIELWQRTAVQTDVGSVVNPVGFIEAVRKTRRR